MEAKEIMVGNYFLDRGNKILRVDGWENSNKIYNNIGFYECGELGKIPFHPLTEEIGFLKPIPLTEELLLKFGFEKSGSEFYDNISYFRKGLISVHIIDGAVRTIAFGNQRMKEDLIKYVHQLQNLYFALTGQELTFKD